MRPLAVVCLVALAGCPLPGDVRYRCEGDGTCAIKGTECRADGYCHPVEQPGDDGGMPCDRTIDLAQRCLAPEVECGYARNGCGDELFCEKWCPALQQCGAQQPNRCGYPSLCTDGWCWENPLPQGYTLWSSFALDEHHVWFVGDNETILSFDGEKLAVQPTPTPSSRVTLLDVHAAAADEAFAVGRGGRLLAWNGARWSAEGTVTSYTGDLRAVWALGQGLALAGGSNGTVLIRLPQFDPVERWKQANIGTNNPVRALYVDAAGVAYALTDPPGLYASAPGNYESWAPVNVSPLPGGRRMAALGDSLYLGGVTNNGASLGRLDADGGYSVIAAVTSAVGTLFAGDGGLWLVSSSGAVSLLDAQETLTPTTLTSGPWQTGVWLPQGRPLLGGMAGVMALVTPAGGAVHWSPLGTTSPASMNLNAVCGSAPDVMYAAGSRDGFGCGQGTSMGGSQACMRFATRRVTDQGVSWEWYRAGLGGTQNLLACYTLERRRFWLTGDDSKFVYWDSTASPTAWGWGDFTGSFGGQYTGAWGLPDAGFYFARGANELTYSPTGENGSFSAVSTGSSAALSSVWGTGGDHVVAVGASGTITRFDGTDWESAANVANAELLAVHGAQRGDGTRRYVVAGTNGVLLSGTGEPPWQTWTSASAQRFNQVWVSGTGVAWAAGVALDGGAWVERAEPGGAWEPVPLVSPRGLTGLFGFDHADGGHTVWVTGAQGLILRKP